MISSLRLRSLMLVGASMGALLASQPASAESAAASKAEAAPPAGGGAVLGEIVVTAQKRSENIQTVPIAVSAFTAEALKAQHIEGGNNLQLAVPNVNFSRGNFGGYNFQIRGIGTKLVATSAEGATGIHENYIPLQFNTLADAEFFDVERVEVLRGPQGTLYGRNATGGVVNIISAKPIDQLAASITGDFGSFDTKRFRAMVNTPIGDTVAVRLAGIYLNRSGYGKNLTTGGDNDGRNLWAARGTISWKPIEKFQAQLMWEHFDEIDNRARTGKQLCIKDPGPASVGGVATNSFTRGFLSQGCTPGSIYSPQALGEVNSVATLGGGLGVLTGLLSGDAYAGKMQDPNLYNIEAARNPEYKTRSDLYSADLEYELTDNLKLTSITAIQRYSQFTSADYNRASPVVPFNNTPFSPGGVFSDPQVGTSNLFRTFDQSNYPSHQASEELRLTSSFKGPFNFSLGAIWFNFNTQTDYFVFSNTLTAYSRIENALTGSAQCAGPLDNGVPTFNGGTGAAPCVFVDPTPVPLNGIGHNYFDSRSVYELRSRAIFGEIYYNLTDDIKVTGGFRFTDDRKKNTVFTVPLLAPGIGIPADGVQYAKFDKPTGRFNIDWTPKLSFTDQTLLYASYSRGYKAGGFNPPGSVGVAGVTPNYLPEFVDAFEVGTKNTLLDHKLVLNLTGFYYIYSGYQVSAIVNRTSVNSNIDATIKGIEFESIYEPIENLRFNAQVGLLDTSIGDASQIDVLNRTQGDPTLTLVKASNFANCVAPTSDVATIQSLINASVLPSAAILGICSGAFAGPTNPLAGLGVNATPSEGHAVSLKGNQLPNAPHATISLGAQYRFELPHGWSFTPRIDYYHQTQSYSRIFNTEADKLNGYDNINMTFDLVNQDMGVDVLFYIRNVANKVVITDSYLTDDSSGLFTNIFLNEPRVFGVAITKNF